ncbi:MAG: hypothetical protein RL030_1771 [Pseudomonadota bacterium]|jgi:hypothetical protein
MSKTYILGTIGHGGRQINFAGGQLFEEMNNGEFKNKAEARKAAAEVAQMWARDDEDGTCDVAIIVSENEDSIPDLMTVATATVGRKTVQWS